MDLIRIYLIEHRLKFRFSKVSKYFNFNLFDQSYTFASIYQDFILKKYRKNDKDEWQISARIRWMNSDIIHVTSSVSI